MIIDLETTFSAAQAVTSTAISTNVIDLQGGGAQGAPTLVDLGAGRAVWLWINVGTAATAAGAATVTFSLESDSTADLATSATVHWTSTAIGKATLIAGYNVVKMRIPAAKTYERYLGVRYTVATGPLTAGTFNAYLLQDVQAQSLYAAGYSIS